MNDQEKNDTDTELFVQQLTAHQNRLFSYVYSLIGDHSRASDVLQEANLVLWRKHSEFVRGRPFLPWAFAIARNQVLANLRDKKRDKCLLDAELVQLLASDSENEATQFETTRKALRHCLEALTSDNRELIRQRYEKGKSIREVAATVGRGASATKVALLRVRRQLADCISRRIVAEAS